MVRMRLTGRMTGFETLCLVKEDSCEYRVIKEQSLLRRRLIWAAAIVASALAGGAGFGQVFPQLKPRFSRMGLCAMK